ncbi:MAG TPA: amidase [Saprospiraceae bacterium]|nr:amidase [Saprospiraceae bacterium]
MQKKYFFILIGGIVIILVFISHRPKDDIKDLILNASELVGLSFSLEKIDMMVPGVLSHKQSYLNNRLKTIDNSVPPALHFYPFPSEYTLPEYTGFILSNYEEEKLTGSIDSLAFFTIAQLSSLIRTRQITSVELTDFYIKRLKRLDSTLMCVISFTEDRAMRQALKMDEELLSGLYRGPLHGIPCGIKDLLATKDYKTTWGARPFQDQHIDYDAEVVKRLEEAGAVIVAKLTLGALAWGDVWFGGMTRNPWDISKGSSGSSAGSASAVAAGGIPFAIGSETLGSIISPSTVCGTTGLRPTYGRVSRYGAMALSWSMDKLGPIGRSAEDCLMVLRAIEGKDEKDPMTYDVPLNYNAEVPLSSLRIGYIKKDFDQDYPFRENDLATLEILRLAGADLIAVELPEYPDIGFILQAEAAAAFDELTTTGKDDSMVRQIRFAWPNTFREARLIPAVEYIKANRLRTSLIQDMDVLMKQLDAYIHPSWASSSLRITNLTGHPCIVIPNGFKDGLPTSISITGRLFEEGTIVRIAQEYQHLTNYHLRHPRL